MAGLEKTLEAFQRERSMRQGLDIRQGLGANPDDAARTRDLARRYSMPPGVVEEFRGDYEQRAKLEDARAIVERSDPLRRWLAADPTLTKIAHDDLGNLSQIAETIRANVEPPSESGGFLSNLGGAARSGLMSGAGGIYGIGRAVADVLLPADVVLPGEPMAGLAEFFAAQSKRFAEQAGRDMPRSDDVLARGFYSGIASTIRTAPGLMAAFLPGGQGVALGMMTTPVGGESYQTAREAGLGVERALAYGVTQAGIEYLTEKIPVSRLFGDLAAGSSFAKTLGRQLAAEIPGEQAATILQDLSEWATLNPDKPFMDYVRERPEAAIETLVATVVGTAVQTGTLSAVDAAVARVQERGQRATLAEQQAATLERMTALAQASKVAARDPQSFESFIEQAAENGPVDAVYIDGQAFFQFGLDQVEGLSEQTLQQLPAAASTGGMVRIPVAEFAARIAPTEQSAAVLDHIKTDPEGFTRAEAQEYVETQGPALAAEIEQAMAVDQADAAFRESRDRVRDTVLEELNAAGRFRPEKNAIDAELIAARTATRAAQLGVMPEEFFERQRVRFAAPDVLPEGGVRLNQPAFHGSPHLFDEFRLSAIGTGEGAQAYGWGLYFAENRSVADSYRSELSGDLQVSPDVEQRLRALPRVGSMQADAMSVLSGVANDLAADPQGTAAFLRQQAASPQFPDDAVTYNALADAIDAGEVTASSGALYEVEIPDEAVARFLDWDAPLSEQPATVRDAFELAADTLPNSFIRKGLVRGVAAQAIYQEIGTAIAPRDAGMSEIHQAASQWLLEHGVPGIRFFDAASRNSGEGTRNLVVFDESLVTIKSRNGEPIRRVLEQASRADQPRGAYLPDANVIALLDNADLSTFLHESAHYFFESDIALAAELIARGTTLTEGEQEIVNDVSALLRWHGIQGTPREQLDQWALASFEERRAYHERTAESFERYLFEGNAPSVELAPFFARFRAWLLNVYQNLKKLLEARPDAGALTDEVRAVFDRMLATNGQIAVAEQARSMMPLWESAEAAGMSPEEFARYHALGIDATTDAIRELEAKGLRDMRWLHRARGREVARLKREAKAARAEVEMEVRREVMSRPVYRAWRFLTAKQTEEDLIASSQPARARTDSVDPETDSLFGAIAKLGGLNKQMAVEEWGVDPKAAPPSPVFGKPVWRLGNEGHSPDAMAQMLAEAGFLYEGGDGRPGLHELESKFDRELAGDLQRSLAYDYGRDLDVVPGSQMHNRATIAAGRIDLESLRQMDVPDEVVDTLVKRRMTKRDAIHPDLVAEMVPGFDSGDQLVRELAAAPDPRDVINETVDQRMVEQYGELSSPAAIERAADQAVHNEVRARMVAAELNALDKSMNARQDAGTDRRGRRRTVAILPAAAKEFAANMIARVRIRDIRPGQYAAAQARASKAASKAMGDGNTAQAAAEKRNQLINHYATRAAYDAQDEVARGVAYLKKFDRPGTRKNLTPDYLDQIDALLDKFDLRQRSLKAIDREKSLAEWVQQQQDLGFEPTVDAARLEQAQRTHYRNLTVEEFRGVVEAVENIEHLGRLKQRLLKAQDQRALDEILNEAAQSIRDNGGKAKPIPIDEQEEKFSWLQGLAAGHRKFASLLRQMDGGKDGGPMWRALGRGMNDAATVEAVMIEEATEALAALYAPILKMRGGAHGNKQHIPEIGQSLSRGARLAVALNWGNDQNRQRLLDGRGWTPEQAQAVLNRLTPAEWNFVESVWSYLDTFWPEIEAKEKRVSGKAPEKVPAMPFEMTMPDGSTRMLRGGYYPIKFDQRQDVKAEQQQAEQVANEMKRGAYVRSTTRRGHTKARAEEVSRPVRLSLDVITEHVSQVAHDLAWHEWLIDANRILGSSRIQSAIRDHYGPAVSRTMREHLTGIATADLVPQTAIDTALLYLRAQVSRSTMGLSLTTAFLQPFGLTQSMVRIGPQWVLRGLARWGGDTLDGIAREGRFTAATQWVYGKSDFMRLRAKTFNRELHEIRGRVSKGRSKARTLYDASLFMLMQKMQLVADVPTWVGQYEKSTAAGLDEQTAIAQADQAVLDSQGGGQTKDLAELQRKHPMLAMFYSYFNVTYNLAAESSAKVDIRNPLTVAGWISDMMLLMVIPALGPAIILHLLRGGGDDEPEEWAAKLAKWQAAYLLGTAMGLRETSGLVEGFDYAGPPVGRVIQDLGRFATQVGQGEVDENLALSAVRLFGTAAGVPTVQAIRSYRGWQAWEDGDAPPTSLLLGPPPKD